MDIRKFFKFDIGRELNSFFFIIIIIIFSLFDIKNEWLRTILELFLTICGILLIIDFFILSFKILDKFAQNNNYFPLLVIPGTILITGFMLVRFYLCPGYNWNTSDVKQKTTMLFIFILLLYAIIIFFNSMILKLRKIIRK